MKRFPAVLAAAVLGAAGFAAAGIASGSSLLHVLTGTTESTPTVTTVGTTTTAEGGGGRRVTLCHHTGSKKHPGVTITVDQHAVKAHLKHHDTLGACQPTAASGQSKHGHKQHGKPSVTHASTTSHGNGKKNGRPPIAPTPVAPITTSATTTTSHGNSGNSGNNGHGNSGNSGNSGSHGHGKP